MINPKSYSTGYLLLSAVTDNKPVLITFIHSHVDGLDLHGGSICPVQFSLSNHFLKFLLMLIVKNCCLIDERPHWPCPVIRIGCYKKGD